MKIYFTDPANADLKSIENYIREDNPIAAVSTVQCIVDSIKRLSLFPSMGRLGRSANTRELIISGTPYIVKYQLRQDRIIILRVLHAAREWP